MTCCCIIIENGVIRVEIRNFDCGIALVGDNLLQSFILYGQDILCHMGLRILSIASNAVANVTCYTSQMKLIRTESGTVGMACMG